MVIGLSTMLLLFIAMIAATPASADDVIYVSVSGNVQNQYNTPLNGVVVTLTYDYNSETVTVGPIISSDGSFEFTNIPQGVYFSLSASWNGVTTDKDDFTDGDRNVDLIIETTSFWAYVTDQDGTPIDYARVIFSYNDGVNWIRGDSDSEGLYFFDWVPVGVDFSLSASIDDTPYQSNIITGTSNVEMVEQDLVIDMSGGASPTPVPSPAPTVAPRPTWYMFYPSWYSNDTNPWPTAAPTPVPTPVPTSVPAPVVTPTPTPVPSSSENTFLSNTGLWLLLLVIIVVVCAGVWMYMRQK